MQSYEGIKVLYHTESPQYNQGDIFQKRDHKILFRS